MKILIDMQPLQTPFSSKRGVGSYVSGIISSLHDLAASHTIEFLFNGEFPEQYFHCLSRFGSLVTRENSHVFTQKILSNYRSGNAQEIAFAERFYTAFVEDISPDILFSPNLQEGLDDRAVTAFAGSSRRFAQVATLHDLIPLHLSEIYLADPATNRWYRRKIADAMRCDRIITVSDNAKTDIENFLDMPSARVTAIPNGYDHCIFNAHCGPNEEEEVKAFVESDEPYLLCVGGADYHKNLPRLVEAYAKLPRGLQDEYSLVIGGRDARSASAVLRAISENGLEERVKLPGFVPISLLPALIRQASLFIFPSTHEGFGLPALEAMACGTPTVGSATTSVGEIIGLSDATFDAYDPANIASTISRALTDETLRAKLRDHGLQRAASFSWRKSAEQVLTVMEEEHSARLEGGSLSFISARIAELGQADRSLTERTAKTIAESAPPPRVPRIFLDASSVAIHGGNSGIQRVVRAICQHLQGANEWGETEIEVVYAASDTTAFRLLTSVGTNGTFIPDEKADPQVEFQPSDIVLFLDLEPNLAIRMEFDVQRLRSLGIKVYYLLYDLLPALMPEKFWPELQNEFYRWLQAVSRSDGLICISRTVAEEAALYLGRFGVCRPDTLSIDYFHLGSDINSASPSLGVPSDGDQIEQRLGADLKFLMVGTVEPRKGHEQTILAFEEAWRSGKNWRLIIVGKQGWKMNRLALNIRSHPEFGQRLFWFEKASDEWLNRLYELSDCVICPSEGEGFGLPLVEAARHGKPVVARDIPVFREVAGNGAFYFPPSTEPMAITNSLLNWTELFDSGQHPASNAMEPLRWEVAARQLAKVLVKDNWHLQVRPKGAVDLKHETTESNPNIRTSGFYTPEQNFAWTTSRGIFEFETCENYKSVSIAIDCFSWKSMPFKVLLDGKLIYSALAETSPKQHEFDAKIMSGKHKLELISEKSGTPKNDDRILGVALRSLVMQANMQIAFGEWLNARDARIRWKNFSPVEFDWRWTLGEQNFLEFEAPEADSNAIITLFGHAAKPREVIFRLNGNLIHRVWVQTDTDNIELPESLVKQGRNVLEIQVPNVGLFSQNDRRALGLAILDLKVDHGKPSAESDQIGAFIASDAADTTEPYAST